MAFHIPQPLAREAAATFARRRAQDVLTARLIAKKHFKRIEKLARDARKRLDARPEPRS
jgi:hypothetical protein